MGRLAISLYYTPTLEIGLENLEPVNKKGKGESGALPSPRRGVWPRPGRADQDQQGMAARGIVA